MNSKNVWQNNVVKAAVEKRLHGSRYELDMRLQKMEELTKEKREVKRCIYQSKKEVNEQFGRKMNHMVNGNRKLFWKEVSKVEN